MNYCFKSLFTKNLDIRLDLLGMFMRLRESMIRLMWLTDHWRGRLSVYSDLNLVLFSSHKSIIWLQKTWNIAHILEPFLWCFCILLKLESFSSPFILMKNKTGIVYCIYFFCFKKVMQVWENMRLFWLECMMLIAIHTVFVRKTMKLVHFARK